MWAQLLGILLGVWLGGIGGGFSAQT